MRLVPTRSNCRAVAQWRQRNDQPGDPAMDPSRPTPELCERLQRLGAAPHIIALALNHRSGTFSGVAGIYQRHRCAKEFERLSERLTGIWYIDIIVPW